MGKVTMQGKILIVDDVATNRIVLKSKLGAAFYKPLVAADGASCLRVATEQAPDLILLGNRLPDLTGVEVLRRLRANQGTRDIPVVFLASDADGDSRMQAFQEGADDYLQKPVDDQMLLARLRNLLRSREAESDMEQHGHPLLGLAEGGVAFDGPGRIALVTDTTGDPSPPLAGLRREWPGALIALSREDALTEGQEEGQTPDIYVIEADCAAAQGGLRLMSELRSRPASRHAAICILCSSGRPEGAAMAYDLGASDVLPITVAPQEFGLRLRKMLRRKQAADRMRASLHSSLRAAIIDPLTGLHNRRYAMPYLGGIAERARMAGLPYAVLVLDLDRFKAVNDVHGHAAGDAVLVAVSRCLTENLREGDLLARIGGEEFLVGLPDTGLPQARLIAERLRRVVGDRAIHLPNGGQIAVTLSVGLSVGNGDPAEPVEAVIDQADQALLQAKSAGRNQVAQARGPH